MRKLLFYFVYALMLPFSSWSQATKTDPTDAEGWYSASLKLDLPKKWETNLTYEARFYNNLKTYYGSFISLSGTKSVSKVVKLSGEYRVALLEEGITHRYTLGMEATWKFKKKLELATRLQIQNRIQDAYDPLEATDKTLFWRFRTQLKYPLHKDWDIYGSVEPIMEVGGDNFVDNWRNTLGFKYKGLKKTKIDLFYIYRPDYGKKTYNRLYHIIGLNVAYQLKVKSGKEKKK